MRKIFTFLFSLLTISAFAATEPTWYNDVTSITNNGQYYIYSVKGAGFMQAGNSAIKTINQNTYNTTSGLVFTVANPSGGNVYNGSNYLYSYQAGSTCGPVHGNGSDKGTNIVWTLMENGSFWNIHSLYDFLGNRYAALYYTGEKYDAVVKDKNPISQNRKDTYTDVEYQWYVISPAHYDRHWAIYLYDRYKETISDYTKWENLVPAAYYTALADAYAVTYNVKNAEHSKEVVNAHRADLKALYDNAEAVANAYANAKTVINALEAVEDKGEDFAEVTAGITAARTAIEQAMSVEALNAAVSAPALKGIDPITFNVTTFIAGKELGTPASTTAGRAITYDAADKTIINAAGQPIYKGATKLTATAAATNDYYKFVRSANVTVNAENTEAQEAKTITYGDNVSWHGKDLSAYTVGQHTLTFDTLNIYGGAHKITLTLTVNKIETLNVPVELSFCEGSSDFYRGVEYKAAGTYPVNATGATRDTVYNVTVTVLQPTAGTDTKTIVYGAEESWNGIALKDSMVGVHTVTYVTENAAGCDSTVTLTLTVNKIETLNVPVELSFCEGGSEFYRGVEYKTAGTYPVNATGAVRDTVYNVTVTVLQPTFGTEAKTIVYGAEESWNGIALKDSTVGVHYVVYTTTNIAGCDSTVTLTLTVTKADVVEVPVELVFCAGDSAEYREVWYKEAGFYPVYVEDAVRDTVYNVTVKVNEPSATSDEMTITFGDDVEWNGIALKDSTVGVHYVVYETKNVAGCDSIVTLTLTVEKMETLETEPVLLGFCPGDSVEYRGKWYFESGLDTIYVEDAVRDTIIYVEAVVLPTSYEVLNDTVLSGHEIILPEGEWIIDEEAVSGTYSTVQSAETTNLVFYQYNETGDGCEAIVELNVVVESNFEAIDTVWVDEQAEKFFHNGVLYIRRGEKEYSVDGRLVK